MKTILCRICHARAATGKAFSKAMRDYAKPTPVCDKCGADHEGKGGRVVWKAKQKKLITE